MLPSLISQKMAKEGLSLREAARQIGLNSHGTLVNALGGRSIDIDTAYSICKWLGVPLSVAVSEAGNEDRTIAAIAAVLNSAPELKQLFMMAADEVTKGNLPLDDFKEIVAFATWKIKKGFDHMDLPSEELTGNGSPED